LLQFDTLDTANDRHAFFSCFFGFFPSKMLLVVMVHLLHDPLRGGIRSDSSPISAAVYSTYMNERNLELE
jgi:hypothetical protein